mmetsp:Transcript_89934/g.226155  ORF Transcript_89934/g.226155 Transcript_89934/m.226155 type:complete len:204 (-) Transcript_89934:78-689(-)
MARGRARARVKAAARRARRARKRRGRIRTRKRTRKRRQKLRRTMRARRSLQRPPLRGLTARARTRLRRQAPRRRLPRSRRLMARARRRAGNPVAMRRAGNAGPRKVGPERASCYLEPCCPELRAMVSQRQPGGRSLPCIGLSFTLRLIRESLQLESGRPFAHAFVEWPATGRRRHPAPLQHHSGALATSRVVFELADNSFSFD